MTIKNTVETLSQTAVSTALGAVRDPFGTAARATGLVKDTAGAGIGLVRSRIGGAPTQAPAPAEEIAKDVQETTRQVVADVKDKAAGTVDDVKAKAEQVAPAKKAPATKAPAKKAPAQKAPAEDPRDEIPGPDLAPYIPPAPEDLPEPIVIVAE